MQELGDVGGVACPGPADFAVGCRAHLRVSLPQLSNTLPRVTDEALRRTPLYEQHAELGAKLVPFAGWEMPVTYEGIREEHSAVRTHAGMFDVSHMGEVEVEGPGALAFLQRVLSNDVAKIEIGGAQYSASATRTAASSTTSSPTGSAATAT